MVAGLDSTLSAVQWVTVGYLLGVGSGATLMPTMTIALRDLESAHTPRGTTLLALTQQLSAAVGSAYVLPAILMGMSVVAALRSRKRVTVR